MSTTAVIDGVCYIQSQDTVVTRRVLVASARNARWHCWTTPSSPAGPCTASWTWPSSTGWSSTRDTPQHVVRDLARRSVPVEVARP